MHTKRQRFYQSIDAFWHDLYDTEYALYDVKLETKETVFAIQQAANRVGHVFFKTAQLLRALDDETLLSLGFPTESLAFIRLKTMDMESVISRLDFVVHDSEIKLLELNADTPTFIKELFHVNGRVCDHFNVQDPNEQEEKRLAFLLHRAIFNAYHSLKQSTYPNVVFSSHGDHDEDKLTTTYLMELANVHAKYVPLHELKIIDEPIYEQGRLVTESGLYDADGERVDVLYRQTYPIEHLVEDEDPDTHEKVGQMLMKLVEQNKLAIINPPSAFLLQSKAIQVLIWGLHEEKHSFFTEEEHDWIHTYFLPTYLEEDTFWEKKISYVKKPSFGREGDTVEIYHGNGEKAAEDIHKTYQDAIPIYQQFVPLPTTEITTEKGKERAHVMYGCFLLNGKASAVGIRAGNQITDNASYYLPIGLQKEK
ncbi:glutathionylspermidine synthase family protein [Priestia megaterium]|nr:glutathionylspermidine synthase family protein [Priestia megaterium]